ncbi:probable adenylate kinase 7, mitochondrial [Impatiens glandulifera]|uniref:probable adenylate kinase 7, mitochondrial n=1 Tax=Impatiens glandulifera TaxID=253017 RepID=UPI001FB1391C|nr:probable adenylate kinase 7, mitochondrial [Impatiens glandulifera]
MAGLSRFMKVATASASVEITRFLGLIRPRSYGSAAAVQLHDDYDYDDRHNEFNLPTEEDSQGSVPRRGIQWVIMGNPLAKKHVYVERLSKLLHVPHISMGTLVRQELHPSSSIYKQIANAVNQGKLVPEDIIFGLLSKRLQEGHYRGENGFILDGIPRNRVQAEILDEIVDIDLVVNFKCREEFLNLGTSGIYTPSQDFMYPGKFNLNMGLKESSSCDDTRKEKFRAYAEQSKPLEDYYRQQKKLLDFQVNGGHGETWQGLLAALQLQHVMTAAAATTSSPKLSV